MAFKVGKAASSILRIWPRKRSASKWEDTESCADSSKGPLDDDGTESCADSSKGPLDDDGTESCADSSKGPLNEDDAADDQPYQQGILKGADRTISGVPAILRKSYQIQHPIQTLRVAFGNITEDEYREIRQYWHHA